MVTTETRVRAQGVGQLCGHRLGQGRERWSVVGGQDVRADRSRVEVGVGSTRVQFAPRAGRWNTGGCADKRCCSLPQL